jgi:tetratricopeptide (TPR) repeat protein
MKKNKSISKKMRKKDKKKKQGPVNVNQVARDADAAMESLDMERAMSLYTTACTVLQQQAAETNPVEIARILLKLGEVKVALENQEGARQDFERAISVLKDTDETTLETCEIRASLYLYLGQLSSNQEALAAARNGIQELQAAVRLREQQLCEHNWKSSTMETDSDENDEQALQETKRQLSRAYCTVADLYLTDLCFEENAEEECQAAVNAAMNIMDEPLVDSLQTMANLRLSQGRGTEAAKCMLQAYAQLQSGCEALAALVGLAKKDDTDTIGQGAVELTDVDAANNLPPFDFRCQTAKILMECATVLNSEESNGSSVTQQVVECSHAAVQVLASLLAENDEVIEVWYLMGCAFAASSPPDFDAAGQYWMKALELLTRMKDHVELVSNDDETQENPLDEINIQIEEVKKRLKEIGHEPGTQSTDVEMCT